MESNVTLLNVGEKAVLTVIATYSDNSIKELNANIEWIITPEGSVDVSGSVLTAKKDGDVTVQAKVDGILSNVLSLNITWIVDGHELPPEPDPIINNSTLLGIDVNNNDVRDDVERWIYTTYKDKHPVHIDIAMQAGRGYKKVLESPENAKQIHDEVVAAGDCESYYKIYAKYFNEPLLVQNEVTTKYFREKIYFNTMRE